MNSDIYEIQLIPLRNSDKKKLQQNNQNPLQRAHVKPTTILKQVSDYICDSAFPSKNKPLNVDLLVAIDEKMIQLPLTMAVSEINFIFQSNIRQLRYAFSDIKIKEERVYEPPNITSDRKMHTQEMESTTKEQNYQDQYSISRFNDFSQTHSHSFTFGDSISFSFLHDPSGQSGETTGNDQHRKNASLRSEIEKFLEK